MTRIALVALSAAFTFVGTATAGVSVRVDRTQISTQLGRKFEFRSTVRNLEATPTEPLVAHLNILSLRPGVYVDPEDWSSQRTRFLGSIPAKGSKTITWKLQAVNAGSIGVYVAVLPQSGAARPPTTGPALHVTIAERKTLNSGGILPLALGVPGLLGAAWLTLRLRRAR
jgi:hypothetical protein